MEHLDDPKHDSHKSSSDSESDYFSSSSSSDDEAAKNRGVIEQAKHYLHKKQRRLLRAFMNYGPPYSKKESCEPLLDEVCGPEPSFFEVHNHLNNRVNPNFRDPEDFYFTPMHYCARHCHLSIMKLLRRAQADLNLVNEFGQTPLSIACMMRFPEFKTKIQLKTIQWMIIQGADVNIRDKGGYCAVDYAAMNNFYDIVKLLLENGAHVLRDNTILVARRQNLLNISGGDEVREILLARIQEEKLSIAEEAERKHMEYLAHQEELRLSRRHDKRAELRKTNIEKRKKERSDRFKEMVAAQREEKLQVEMEKLKRDREADKKKFGEWKRSGENGTWEWEAKPPQMYRTRQDIYPESQAMMKHYHEKYKFDNYNDRWKVKTGNDLEIPWSKNDVFDITDRDAQQQTEGVPDSLEFRDENDAELEGENLDDFLT